MVEHVSIDHTVGDPATARETEFVERKGRGHPDSLCDGIAEAVSRRLSGFYRAEYGRVLHHNVDKVHLGAGRTEPDFGGGRVLRPIYALVGGRATTEVDGVRLPIEALASEAAAEYLLEAVPPLQPNHIDVDVRIGATSAELGELFERGETPLANDTSFGVGHAPLSPTEELVRTLEPRLHAELEAVGTDVKLLALRRGNRVHLAVAAAILDRAVDGLEAYRDATARVRALAEEHARETVDHEVSVRVNAADDPDRGSIYLTTTGTSAENGDDGAVGRGNRANGLITPHRPMSLEATSGKNPVSHVGKLYNLSADRIAGRLAEEAGAAHSSVQLLSRIGAPIDDPWAVDAVSTVADEGTVRDAVERELDALPELTDAIVAGEVTTF